MSAQLKLGEIPSPTSTAARPFVTDPEIVRRLTEAESLLRVVIRDRGPLAAVSRAADDLRNLAADLTPASVPVEAA